MPETVNHPQHYKSCSADTRPIVSMLGVPERWHDTECIEVIESLAYIRQDFHIATALTYLWRFGQKPIEDAREDLEKATWFINRHREKFPTNTPRDTKAIEMIQALLDGGAINA
jgi:Protein of unknwon function (DUF3310)